MLSGSGVMEVKILERRGPNMFWLNLTYNMEQLVAHCIFPRSIAAGLLFDILHFLN